jgi:RNA polymerase sigma factor (sigma-70 family)
MAAFTLGGLFHKLRPPADTGCDAELLRKFAQARDPEAFAEIVRRHGAMVLAVCRRVLGDGPDAEDAHQIALMALARDAGKIANPHAVGGWLYRVAWLTARKLAGRVHRRKPQPLTTDPTTPMTPSPENDVRGVIDEELLGLPERFRAVAVLCLLEGRTNTEAAGMLGIPKGTVDSRLSTAKAKLRERLLRRGVAAAALLTVEQVLTSETSAAATRAAALATQAITVALDYAAGVPTAGSEHLIHTANGVRPVTSNLKWLAVAMFSTALIGGGGVGVYVANAQEKDTAEQKADPKKPPKEEAKKPPAETPKPDTKADKGDGAKTADDVQRVLVGKVKMDGPLSGLEFGLLIDELTRKTGVTIRVDTAAFVRRGWGEEHIKQLTKKKLYSEGQPPTVLADLLREVLAQAATPNELNKFGRLSYHIKGNEILIVPEFTPSTTPKFGHAADEDGMTYFVTPEQIAETLYGEPVTARYKKKPLGEILEDLQERTGANIVLGNPDCEKQLITANFNDTRLLTVLKIVGDMHNLKPVVIDNVFYLTDANRAEELQREVNRDLFGTPTAPPAKPEAKK